MSDFKFYLHVYRMLIFQEIKVKMSYRIDFIISTIGTLMGNVLGFLSFYIIFDKFESVKGWNFYEILFLYGFFLLATTPANCLCQNNWNLLQHLRSGSFIKYYLRPLDIYFYFISEVFDVKAVGQGVFGIVSIIYAWKNLNLELSCLNMLVFLIGILSASLVMIGIMNIAAACGFWLIGYNFILTLVSKINDYAKYPITIYGKILQFVFTFILPIGFLGYYQSLFFIDANEYSWLTYLSLLFSLLFVYVSYRIWLYGAYTYNATGN